MCGIFSYIGTKINSLKLQEYFQNIDGRGPDYSILQKINNVSLGFHRLSINDLSSSGNQPFSLEGIYLVCNGEIYNHEILKEKFNIETQSNSDCEVLIHMYQKLGFEETCKQIDGVFALIIYDSNTKKIYDFLDLNISSSINNMHLYSKIRKL